MRRSSASISSRPPRVSRRSSSSRCAGRADDSRPQHAGHARHGRAEFVARRIQVYRDVPVIVLTTRGDDSEPRRGADRRRDAVPDQAVLPQHALATQGPRALCGSVRKREPGREFFRRIPRRLLRRVRRAPDRRAARLLLALERRSAAAAIRSPGDSTSCSALPFAQGHLRDGGAPARPRLAHDWRTTCARCVRRRCVSAEGIDALIDGTQLLEQDRADAPQRRHVPAGGADVVRGSQRLVDDRPRPSAAARPRPSRAAPARPRAPLAAASFTPSRGADRARRQRRHRRRRAAATAARSSTRRRTSAPTARSRSSSWSRPAHLDAATIGRGRPTVGVAVEPAVEQHAARPRRSELTADGRETSSGSVALVALRPRRSRAPRRPDAQRRRPGDQPRPAGRQRSPRIETARAGGRVARVQENAASHRAAAARRCAKASCASGWCRSARSSAACRSWSAISRATPAAACTLELQGQDTEIDKFLIERMMDPVLHLVRNAVSHGIETADERIAAGKRPEGTITLSRVDRRRDRHASRSPTTAAASTRRRWSRARAGAGLPVPAGRSTRAALLDADLRARILDARRDRSRERPRRRHGGRARRRSRSWRARMRWTTEPGAGTRFIIELPLTLAITDALIARVGDRDVRGAAGGGARSDRGRRRARSATLEEQRDHAVSRRRAADRAAVAAVRHRRRRRGRACTCSSSAPAPAAVGIAVDRIVGPARDRRARDRRSAGQGRRHLRRDRSRRRPRGADPRSGGARAAAARGARARAPARRDRREAIA